MSSDDLRDAVERVQRNLRSSGGELAEIDRCGTELSEIGSAATAEIEAEFSVLVEPSEPSAA